MMPISVRLPNSLKAAARSGCSPRLTTLPVIGCSIGSTASASIGIANTLDKARHGFPAGSAEGSSCPVGARRIGRIAWAVSEQWVRQSLLVDEAAIRAAQLWLWREMKMAVEPAAGLPRAALQTGAYLARRDEKVCLIICGANFDPASLA
jgi:threonine dehydratase